MPVSGLFRRLATLAAAVPILSVAVGAGAASPMLTFHTFVITELYSTPDGQVQFIELRENSGFNGQGSWVGHSIVAFNQDLSLDNEMPFLTGLPNATANKRVLLATANFAGLPGGVTPDYIIPPNFMFQTGRVQFAGLTGGANVTYAALPTTGNESRGFPGGAIAVNSPTNFAGTAGSINLPPGSCCVGVNCHIAVQVTCTGTFALAGVCDPNPCAPATTGACCNGLNCTVQTGAACGGGGGQYKGDNVACGTVGNPVACCPANFNHVGGVSVQDIFDFLSAYFSNDPAADFNGVGNISVQDIFDFLGAYFTPCPG